LVNWFLEKMPDLNITLTTLVAGTIVVETVLVLKQSCADAAVDIRRVVVLTAGVVSSSLCAKKIIK
jgi:hypothetical protein